MKLKHFSIAWRNEHAIPGEFFAAGLDKFPWLDAITFALATRVNRDWLRTVVIF